MIFLFSDRVVNLVPYTYYTFKISACTNAGCLTDVRGAIVETKMDVPEDQSAPTVTALSATELLVQWQPPLMPNGIMIVS